MPVSVLGTHSLSSKRITTWDFVLPWQPPWFYLHLRGLVGSCWGHSSSNLHQWHSCRRGSLGSGYRCRCPSLNLSSGTCWASPPPSVSLAQLCRRHICSINSNPDSSSAYLFFKFRHDYRVLSGEKTEIELYSHSIRYFSISWTSAIDSRKSSVNFLRSWGLGALKLMRTLMSAPGMAEVRRTPLG